VEAALSTAVNALYSAMPKDPIAFLSNHFVGTATAHRVEKPAPAPPVQHETHVAARGQDNPQYPERQAVLDSHVAWGAEFSGYSPKTWTHPDVLANDRELSTGNQWADPPDVSRAGLASRISYAGDGQSKPLPLDATGLPRNPVGRTGLGGRGLLGKWGPNQAADPIVTRDCPTTGKLQVLAIQRKDTGTWALPGGMVDDGEEVSVTVRRAFEELAGTIADPETRAEFEKQVRP
jgi:ADP-ribose pyrophosphatase